MRQMKQWDVYYVMLAIDFYIPGKRIYRKKNNFKKRRKLVQKVTKMLIDKFWEEGISFYIDAAGFQYKHNPHDKAQSMQTVTWQLKNEGLQSDVSAKGSHVGFGRNIAHFIVAIAHQKGFVLCEQ